MLHSMNSHVTIISQWNRVNSFSKWNALSTERKEYYGIRIFSILFIHSIRREVQEPPSSSPSFLSLFQLFLFETKWDSMIYQNVVINEFIYLSVLWKWSKYNLKLFRIRVSVVNSFFQFDMIFKRYQSSNDNRTIQGNTLIIFSAIMYHFHAIK